MSIHMEYLGFFSSTLC